MARVRWKSNHESIKETNHRGRKGCMAGRDLVILKSMYSRSQVLDILYLHPPTLELTLAPNLTVEQDAYIRALGSLGHANASSIWKGVRCNDAFL